MKPRHYLFLSCFISSLLFYQPLGTGTACALEAKDKTAAAGTTSPDQPRDHTWDKLYARLIRDGFTPKELQPYFAALQNAYSQKPMGNKAKELYTANFVPKKQTAKSKNQPKSNPLGIPYPWYDGYVTDENAQKCRDFIADNEKYFAMAEKQFAVPRHVLSALIYVETWHGKFLGKFRPLPMLASMAATTDLAMVPDYTRSMKLSAKQKKWLQEKVKTKADWAYGELKALLRYSLQNGIDIGSVPSSIYGAIGYGQFMPSNIPRYSVDGNKDGKIDLFSPEDAIPSIANFLHKQGWTQKKLPFAKQVKVLKRYNYSTAYAHTILALAKLSEQQKPLSANKEKK